MSKIKSVKFVASIAEVNKDTDVIAEDIKTTEDIMYFVDEALNRGDDVEVFVVADDMTVAENVAAVLNAQYEKEMELMKDAKIAKAQVNEVVDANEEKDQAAAIAKSGAAKKFMEKHGSKVANAKKAPAADKKEETTEEEKSVKKPAGGRRRLSAGTTQKEETAVNTNTEKKEVADMKKEEVKGNARRRLSTGAGAVEEKGSRSAGGRKRLARGENMRGGEFVKFEGPWYLNASQYEVLNRLDAILEDMADAELGIQNIEVLDPEQTRRYKDSYDVVMVIQLKSNGNILEFPIKENLNSNSKADLKSSAMNWVNYGKDNEKLRLAFGAWKMNNHAVEAKCECGHEFKAHPENVYCEKCGSLYEVIDMKDNKRFVRDFAPKANKLQVKRIFEFVENSNLVVPKETLALVMAIAQYDQGYDMHGVIAE